jgi:hypothetical protein
VKKLITTLAAATSLLVVGCTTRRVEPPRVEPPPPRGGVTLSNAPRFGQPPDQELKAQFCQLGTSCLTLDERPFELCLLDTKHCRDKVVEPLLVDDESEVSPSTEPSLEQR